MNRTDNDGAATHRILVNRFHHGQIDRIFGTVFYKHTVDLQMIASSNQIRSQCGLGNLKTDFFARNAGLENIQHNIVEEGFVSKRQSNPPNLKKAASGKLVACPASHHAFVLKQNLSAI